MKNLLLIFILSGGQLLSQSNETVEFTVSAPKTVTVGKAFRITFTLNAELENFTVPDFGGFTVLAGPSRSTTKNSSTNSCSMSMVYILQANQEGTVNIGAAKATIEGKTYQTKTLSIQIVAARSTSQNNNTQNPAQERTAESNQNISADETDVFARIQLSKSTVLQGEHLIATIKLYTQQMNIVGFEDVKFPTFNGFWSQELETPQQLQFQRENVNGKLYNTAVLRRYLLFPQQTGTLKIDPFEVNCVLQVYAKNSQPSSFIDSFFDSPQNIRKHIQSPYGTVKVESSENDSLEISRYFFTRIYVSKLDVSHFYNAFYHSDNEFERMTLEKLNSIETPDSRVDMNMYFQAIEGKQSEKIILEEVK
ncbi:MAG: BatD family protein [Bacteroidales bacterium]|jgi:hypothetical protein|nr:BatD family protein [Bacteroidales bacterium]